MPPRVSVVMSVFDGARYLRQAVDSILGQTFSDFEFIIIDDGSTDDTAIILAEYAVRDRRIRLSHHPVNIGLTPSLNEGLQLARGEYVARMDADDISLPERFAQQVKFLEARPEVGVAGSWFQLIDELGRTTSEVFQTPSAPGFVAWSLYFYNPIAHPSVMLRREVVVRAGGYNATLARSQDHDLWCRLCGFTQLTNVQAPLIQLRKHAANISSLQYADGLRASIHGLQGRIARALRREVPQDILRSMYTREYPGPREALEVAALINALARASLAEPTLTAEERRMIGADAAQRLKALLPRGYPHLLNWRVWQVLNWVHRLDPTVGRLESARRWLRPSAHS